MAVPRISPDDVAHIFLLSSIAQIHLHIAGSVPCLSAGCFIVSNEVLSKAPSVSRNAPRARFLYSVAFYVCGTTLYSAVSVDVPIW
jgi:hypothetical protein